MKSEEAARYFCDDRENFIEMIFQEMWKFTNDFQKTVKVGVCILNYHIISCVHCFYAGCETE